LILKKQIYKHALSQHIQNNVQKRSFEEEKRPIFAISVSLILKKAIIHLKKTKSKPRTPIVRGQLGNRTPDKKRRYGVTRKKNKKVTSFRNTNFGKFQRERPNLTEHLRNKSRNRKRTLSSRDKQEYSDILTIWPKIVEYAGLSEYEAKVYLSLLGLGSSGARRLSLHCHVPRTKV
jgi:hypothetical protein